MKNRTWMDEFKHFYVWGMNLKFYIGIYFTGLVFLCGVLTAVLGGNALRLMALVQMLVVAFAMAALQTLFLPDSLDLTRSLIAGRALLFSLVSALLCGFAGALLGWLAPAPAPIYLLLGFVMMIGCFAMVAGMRFEQEIGSTKLNKGLTDYKQKHP